MKTFLIMLIYFLPFNVEAQQVRLITLDDLYRRIQRGNDTTYIINFWATWCAPCLEELPHFEKLSASFNKSPLKVILVSLDARSKMNKTVVPYVQKKMLSNEVFLLADNDPQIYINRVDLNWSGALPATLMVHKNTRRFYEQEFSYEELLIQYNKIKKYETPISAIGDRYMRFYTSTDQYHYTRH